LPALFNMELIKKENIDIGKIIEDEKTLNYFYADFIFNMQKFTDNAMFGFGVNSNEDKKVFLEMFELIKKDEPNIKNMAIVIKEMLNHLLFYFREI